MKKYYLHENKVTFGPISFDELKEMKITAFTPIWCEGFDNWKSAGELAELKPILSNISLPKESDFINPKNQHNIPKDRIYRPNRKMGIVLIISVISVLVALLLNNHQSKKIISIEKTNKEIQKENFLKKIEEQKLILEKQNKILSKKEEIEKNRLNNGRQNLDRDTYKKINSALSNCYKGLEEAKNELKKVKSYKFLRSAKKKEEQIKQIEYEIETWKRKIELLKLEKLAVENRLKY